MLNKIYVALAQSIIIYCIPVWGGAAKTKFIELERAQRSLLKVMYFKSYRFPSDLLYSTCQLLSVRKLYIVQVVLKLHKTLNYEQSILSKRIKYNIAKVPLTRSSFAGHQYNGRSAHLYNSINKILDIYPLKFYNCKKRLTEWIKTKTYEETEALLHVIS